MLFTTHISVLHGGEYDPFLLLETALRGNNLRPLKVLCALVYEQSSIRSSPNSLLALALQLSRHRTVGETARRNFDLSSHLHQVYPSGTLFSCLTPD